MTSYILNALTNSCLWDILPTDASHKALWTTLTDYMFEEPSVHHVAGPPLPPQAEQKVPIVHMYESGHIAGKFGDGTTIIEEYRKKNGITNFTFRHGNIVIVKSTERHHFTILKNNNIVSISMDGTFNLFTLVDFSRYECVELCGLSKFILNTDGVPTVVETANGSFVFYIQNDRHFQILHQNGMGMTVNVDKRINQINCCLPNTGIEIVYF